MASGFQISAVGEYEGARRRVASYAEGADAAEGARRCLANFPPAEGWEGHEIAEIVEGGRGESVPVTPELLGVVEEEAEPPAPAAAMPPAPQRQYTLFA